MSLQMALFHSFFLEVTLDAPFQWAFPRPQVVSSHSFTSQLHLSISGTLSLCSCFFTVLLTLFTLLSRNSQLGFSNPGRTLPLCGFPFPALQHGKCSPGRKQGLSYDLLHLVSLLLRIPALCCLWSSVTIVLYILSSFVLHA